ncbi:MAG: MBL fold metallo-hydrolase [Chloroflexota bacterium]
MIEIADNIIINTNLPGVNVGAIGTSVGVVCIDSPSNPSDALGWFQQVRSRFGMPIRYLILTDHSIDRALSLHTVRTRVIAHQETKKSLEEYGERFPATELDLHASRFDLVRRELDSIPIIVPHITFSQELSLVLGDRTITVRHEPSATAGSSWVVEHDARVMFVGDTYIVNHHPPMHHANLEQWYEILAELRQSQYRRYTIVPGRGPHDQRKTIARFAAFLSSVESLADEVDIVPDQPTDYNPQIDLILEKLQVGKESDSAIETLRQQIRINLEHLCSLRNEESE